MCIHRIHQAKFESILKCMNIPITVFSSIGNSQYRKPNSGGWELFEREWNKGVKIDLARSTFVGDAAGRLAGSLPGKKKDDHSCCDRMVAANVGVPFYTPEEFFLSQSAAAFGWNGAFDANHYLAQLPQASQQIMTAAELQAATARLVQMRSGVQELVLLVGMQGSGKTTLRKQVFAPAGKAAARCLAAPSCLCAWLLLAWLHHLACLVLIDWLHHPALVPGCCLIGCIIIPQCLVVA